MTPKEKAKFEEQRKKADEFFKLYQGGFIDKLRLLQLTQQLGPGWGILDNSGRDHYHTKVYTKKKNEELEI
jgi:hypothetical protein